ncbi:MAG: helix-turn-helix domain-containing protein, partial [Parcubacteria group bacterium]
MTAAADATETHELAHVQTQDLKDAAGRTYISNPQLWTLFKADGLSDGARLTLLALRFYAWNESNPFPSQATLAEFRGISDRAIRSHVKELIAGGFVEIAGGGNGRPIVYRLLDPSDDDTREFIRQYRPRTHEALQRVADPGSPEPDPGTSAPTPRNETSGEEGTTEESNSKNPPPPREGITSAEVPPAPAPEPDGGVVGAVDCAALNVLAAYGVAEHNARKVLAEQQPTLREVKATVAGCRIRDLGPGAVVNALRAGMYRDPVLPEQSPPPPPDPETLRLHRQRQIETLAVTAATLTDPDERALWFYCSPERPPAHLFDEVQEREAEIRGGTPPERLDAPSDDRLDAMTKQRAARERMERRRAAGNTDERPAVPAPAPAETIDVPEDLIAAGVAVGLDAERIRAVVQAHG